MAIAASESRAATIDEFTLVGFDMELTERNFRWLVPYYDLEYLDQQIITEGQRQRLLKPEILEDYVLNHEAFHALPAALREKLSEGLDLDKKVTLLRDEKMALVDSKGKVQSVVKSLILPNEAGTLKGSSPTLHLPERPKLGSGNKIEKTQTFIRPEGQSLKSDWALLNTRWNNLPLAEKQAAVSISHLDQGKLALLIQDIDVTPKKPEELKKFLRLKANAPDWIKSMSVTLDGPLELEPGQEKPLRPVEYALSEPAEDKKKAFAILNSIINETKTSGIRAAPHKVSQVDTGFHLHIGIKEGAPPELRENLEPVLLEYRRLLAIRMLAAGNHNNSIILPEDKTESYVVQTAYDRWHRDGMLGGPGSGKGLVRRVDAGHVEIREQTGTPEATYKEFTSLLEKGKIEARKIVSEEIQTLMKKDPSIARRLADFNPKLLADFKEGLPPGFLQQALYKNRHDKDFIQLLGEVFERDRSIENFQLLLELRKEMPENTSLDSPYLFHRFEANPNTREAIVTYFEAHPEEAPLEAYDSIMEWAGKNTDIRIDMLKNSKDAARRARIASALFSHYLTVKENSPEAFAEKQRFHSLLREICATPSAKDPICLMAQTRFELLKLPPALSEADAISLAKKNIWNAHRGISQNATSVLVHTKVFSHDVGEGYTGVNEVMDYLSLKHYDDLVSEYAKADEKEKLLTIKALHELRRITGEVPAEVLAGFAKVADSPNPVIVKAAKALLRPLQSSAQVTMHSACALTFAKIKGN